MPFWEIYTPGDALTDEDKEALTKTNHVDLYDFVDLPKFYVVVVFPRDAPQQHLRRRRSREQFHTHPP